jgi:hypothetical protein
MLAQDTLGRGSGAACRIFQEDRRRSMRDDGCASAGHCRAFSCVAWFL